jgi:hypothetical protein
MGVALERFRDALPDAPYCTNDFGFGLTIRDQEQAIRFRNIQVAQHKRHYLCFDIDREGAAFAHEDADMPAPTLTIINPHNAHAHALYELKSPVLFQFSDGTGRALVKPQQYYRRIHQAMTAALGADGSFSGLMVKNPFHSDWNVLETFKQYQLDELKECVAPVDYSKSKVTEYALQGRNNTLFDECRFYAYRGVKEHETFDGFYQALYQFCRIQNQTFSSPLPESEIRSVSKSVTKWVWDRRERFSNGWRDRFNRGACNLPPMPPLMEIEDRHTELQRRKSIGASYTNEIKRQTTEDKIEAAINRLEERGATKLYVSHIAKESGVSRPTVYNYLHGDD